METTKTNKLSFTHFPPNYSYSISDSLFFKLWSSISKNTTLLKFSNSLGKTSNIFYSKHTNGKTKAPSLRTLYRHTVTDYKTHLSVFCPQIFAIENLHTVCNKIELAAVMLVF